MVTSGSRDTDEGGIGGQVPSAGSRYSDRASRPGGFTLVELLVVVLLLALLAAVGVSAVLSRREKVRDATVKNDLKNAASVEIALLSGGGRYASSEAELAAQGLQPSPEVVFVTVRGNANRFCLEAHHVLRPERVWMMDSRTGDFRLGPGGSCPPL